MRTTRPSRRPATPSTPCRKNRRAGSAPARTWALAARDAAKAAGAQSPEADALVTLGLLEERSGRITEAIELFTQAHRQAQEAGVLGVHLRAAFQLARIHLERGDLAQAGATAHEGLLRAE